jgi:hypothetical protein
MAPERHTQDSSRSRHSHHSRRDHDDASSVDSGYGGSAANSPKDTHDVQKDALRDYHAESARHHAESGRRSSQPDEARVYRQEGNLDSDSDYDPRDKYYLKVDDDEYNKMTSASADPAKEDRDCHVTDRERRHDRRRSDASERHRSERRQSTASEKDRGQRRARRESDISNSPGSRSEHDNSTRRRDRDGQERHKPASTARRHSTTSDGSDSGERRTRRQSSSSRHSDASSTLSDSRDRKQAPRRRTDASTASHFRHESNYRSLSPIPSDSWDESDESIERRRSPRRRRGTSRSSRARSEAGSSKASLRSPDRTRSAKRDASARYIDPDGEAAKSFLDKLTKGVDLKSVGKVGLDAAAVAAIKIAVGTQIPWKQRIPKTLTVGAAAAIMDFVVKKTSFKPKGMIGTIYARQFVEIILANLIVNPVSNKITGAAQSAKGKVAAGKPPGGGGGGGKRR